MRPQSWFNLFAPRHPGRLPVLAFAAVALSLLIGSGRASADAYLLAGSVPATPAGPAHGFILAPPYFSSTITVPYSSGTVMLSVLSDGTGAVAADDYMEFIVVGGDGVTRNLNHDFSHNCQGFISSHAPFDVTSLFRPGNNTVTLRLRDACGVSLGNPPFWLAIIGQADVKVTGVTVSCADPASAGVPFSCQVDGTIHNNGPVTPVNTDVSLDLAVPPDCAASPGGTQSVQGISIPASSPVVVSRTWTASCSSPSSHQFTGTVTAVVNQVNISDPNTGNNSAVGSDSVAVIAQADVKITGQVVTAPAFADTGIPFVVRVDKTLHNNGPFGVTAVAITASMNGPADCAITPDVGNPSTASLPASQVVAIAEKFSIACSQPSSHAFSISNCISVITLHVVDQNPSNNCATQAQRVVAVGHGKITVCKDVVPDDPSLWDFALVGPSIAVSADDVGDGQCHEFNLLNSGSYVLMESFQAGYQPSVDCGAQGMADGNSIEFSIAPGDQVVCTFTNAFHPGPAVVGGITGLVDSNSGLEPTQDVDSRASVPALAIALLGGATATLLVGGWYGRRRWLR